jgi:anthranilate synthase component II
MKILVLDNYDSFTYNLVHYLENLGNYSVEVFRNDKIALEAVGKYDKILLSPGPGIPDEAGILKEVIREYASSKSIFGVCLGLQAIGEVFGGKLINLGQVFHGVATPIEVIKETSLFQGIPKRFMAGRYHSWVIDAASFPEALELTAKDEQGQVMALQHKKYAVQAVQFHPESILTEHGMKIMENWVKN